MDLSQNLSKERDISSYCENVVHSGHPIQTTDRFKGPKTKTPASTQIHIPSHNQNQLHSIERLTKDSQLATLRSYLLLTSCPVGNFLPHLFLMCHHPLSITSLFPNLNALFASQTDIVNGDVSVVVPHSHPSIVFEVESVLVFHHYPVWNVFALQ